MVCSFYMGLYTCIMTCICHYSIVESIFTALKLLSLPPLHLFLIPQTLVTTDLPMVSIVLPFPECLIVGIIQYGAFSEWLFLFSNMPLSFRHIFSWFSGSFLLLVYISLFYQQKLALLELLQQNQIINSMWEGIIIFSSFLDTEQSLLESI